jgi:HJR/Mrr/RecB family endonuclease
VHDPTLVDKVIRYNNTQNPIKAWELRVIDPIQRKLTVDFEQVGITYQTRRGYRSISVSIAVPPSRNVLLARAGVA